MSTHTTTRFVAVQSFDYITSSPHILFYIPPCIISSTCIMYYYMDIATHVHTLHKSVAWQMHIHSHTHKLDAVCAPLRCAQ